MSSTPAATTSPKPANPRGRVIFASLIGTSIEFYDFYVYATAAVLVFPALFFPGDDPATSLLKSFAAFGAAFVARPLGSIVFGHFGDRIGRKGTLVASLLTMGIATFVIGILPTGLTPGWEVLAPTLLVAMRFCQGLGLGGEWSGAALLATENAPKGKRAIYGTFPQLGAPIGFILANGVFLVLATALDEQAFQSWGWRVPFLASSILVIVGLYVRFKLIETPAFQKVVDEGHVAKLPLARVFRTSWRPLILGTFIMLATYVLFYLMTTFTLTFGTTPADAQPGGLGYERTDFLIMLIVGVVFFGVFTLVSGPLAERFGRRLTLIVVTAGILVFGLLFVPLAGGGFAGIMALLIVGFSLMGLTFGPMASILPELFPTNVRYTGSAISYNVSSILGAAVAPFIAVALWTAAGGSIWLVGVYLSAMAVLTLVALLLSRETRDIAYESNVA
ncbi:MFS transporter [Homoserinibacter sp. YIM 151385]|uniref:MFS transporter n=1 Tax=Homoserinibacter sp. YIM 151385 TaxID=2985506 RepID=UPI0022F0EE6F|nr:MFS transporter [Homoserinibacter sp. YIM 151385]WBU36841.1 MFS transporter [Homoserinibacter sp. YIM 151385]